MTSRSAIGLSLAEVLVALAVLGLLASLGVAAARPSPEGRAASALRSLLLQARAEALWSGSPAAVVELPGGAGFAALRSRLGEPGCEAGETLAAVRLRDFPRVAVVQGLWSGGLYWLPTGSGRDCTGGGVVSGTVVLRGPRGTASVVVSSLGRVRVEAGP